jgi:hypothetical protein
VATCFAGRAYTDGCAVTRQCPRLHRQLLQFPRPCVCLLRLLHPSTRQCHRHRSTRWSLSPLPPIRMRSSARQHCVRCARRPCQRPRLCPCLVVAKDHRTILASKRHPCHPVRSVLHGHRLSVRTVWVSCLFHCLKGYASHSADDYVCWFHF